VSAHRAETARLAGLLHRPPAAVERLLAPVAADDVRALREQVSDVLFDADRARLARLAAAADHLPVALVATIGRRAFGPLLCARVTALLAPERAVAIGERLDAAFLAELTAELDPRRAPAVVAAVPISVALRIAQELADRGDAVTMARYVGALDDPTLVAALAVVGDTELLHVAVLLDEKDRLDHLLGLLPDDRLLGVLRAAAAEDAWTDALDLLAHLGPDRRARVAAVTARLPDAELDGLVRAAAAGDRWNVLLPLLPLVDEVVLDRLAALPALADPGLRAALLAAAGEHGVAPLVEERL